MEFRLSGSGESQWNRRSKSRRFWGEIIGEIGKAIHTARPIPDDRAAASSHTFSLPSCATRNTRSHLTRRDPRRVRRPRWGRRRRQSAAAASTASLPLPLPARARLPHFRVNAWVIHGYVTIRRTPISAKAAVETKQLPTHAKSGINGIRNCVAAPEGQTHNDSAYHVVSVL